MGPIRFDLVMSTVGQSVRRRRSVGCAIGRKAVSTFSDDVTGDDGDDDDYGRMDEKPQGFGCRIATAVLHDDARASL